MQRQVTREEIRAARVVDLYQFLCLHHPNDIEITGNSVRLKNHHSIVIRKGHSGYTRYSDATEKGNGIKLLMDYLGYDTFVEAVTALSNVQAPISHETCTYRIATEREITLPHCSDGKFSRAFAYLTKTRSITPRTVSALMQASLIYQDEPYGNAVFINRDRDYCEIRGTTSSATPFHSCRKSSSDKYWSFNIGKNGPVQLAYVCESAIDAISLYELHKAAGLTVVPTMYCSVGGVGNQGAIDHIAQGSYQTILAVDNDPAGEACRTRNCHLEHVIPTHKDWNDDLQSNLL